MHASLFSDPCFCPWVWVVSACGLCGPSFCGCRYANASLRPASSSFGLELELPGHVILLYLLIEGTSFCFHSASITSHPSNSAQGFQLLLVLSTHCSLGFNVYTRECEVDHSEFWEFFVYFTHYYSFIRYLLLFFIPICNLSLSCEHGSF